MVNLVNFSFCWWFKSFFKLDCWTVTYYDIIDIIYKSLIVELYLIIAIPLTLLIINLLKFKEVDIMLDIISIDIELLMGGINGSLAVEKE